MSFLSWVAENYLLDYSYYTFNNFIFSPLNSLLKAARRKDTMNIRIGKEDIKLSLVIDDMIVHLKSSQIYIYVIIFVIV